MNRMHVSLIAVSFTFFLSQVHGQGPGAERLKEIKAQRSAYITTQLGLDEPQAQRFWPIYNEMDEKREAIRREIHGSKREEKNASLTEKEARDLLLERSTLRQKELDLERNYTERFIEAIGAVKTVQLNKAEHDFNREVLRKFKDRTEGRPVGPRGR